MLSSYSRLTWTTFWHLKNASPEFIDVDLELEIIASRYIFVGGHELDD